MADSTPSSTKPYLIRAIHEWCSDNGLTPYLAVSVNEQVHRLIDGPSAHKEFLRKVLGSQLAR